MSSIYDSKDVADCDPGTADKMWVRGLIILAFVVTWAMDTQHFVRASHLDEQLTTLLVQQEQMRVMLETTLEAGRNDTQ